MDRRVVLKALGIGGTVLGLALSARAFAVQPYSLGRARAAEAAAAIGAPQPRANADSLARIITQRDPFRMTRAPAAIAFNPEAAASPYGGAPPQPPRAPRPPLALAGIVLGDEPLALIDGLPGVEGSRVMRLGERVGDYVLRAVTSDHAVIVGPDTTWTLRVRSQFP